MIKISTKNGEPEIHLTKSVKEMEAKELASIILLLSNGSFGLHLAELLKDFLDPEIYLDVEDICMQTMQKSRDLKDKQRLAAAGISMSEIFETMGDTTNE